MKAQIIQNPQFISAKQLWPEALLIIILIASLSSFVIFYIIDLNYTVDALKNELASHQLSYIAHILLLASSILYIILLWNKAPGIGRWTTALAIAGVTVTGAAFVTHVYESHKLLQMGQEPVSNLYELSLFFTLFTVSIYLIMEQVFQSRSAGGFITPVIFSAIGLQLWLESNNLTSSLGLLTTLQYYWIHAHMLANLTAYGAFSVAATTATMYLIRQRAEDSKQLEKSISGRFPCLEIINSWSRYSITAGLPVFSLAAILDPLLTYYVWGNQLLWPHREACSIIVILCYASYLYTRHRYSSKAMAWWAILSFLITSSCFFAVNPFLSAALFA